MGYTMIYNNRGEADAYVYDNYWDIVGTIEQPDWWHYNGLEIPSGAWRVAISKEHTSDFQAVYQADRFVSGGHAVFVFDNDDYGYFYQPWRGEWGQTEDQS